METPSEFQKFDVVIKKILSVSRADLSRSRQADSDIFRINLSACYPLK
jgi:hypothetical protein